MLCPTSSRMKRILLLVLAVASMRCQVKNDGLGTPFTDAGAPGASTGGSAGGSTGGSSAITPVGGHTGAAGDTGTAQDASSTQGSGGTQGTPDASVKLDLAGADASHGNDQAVGGAGGNGNTTIGSGGVFAQGGAIATAGNSGQSGTDSGSPGSTGGMEGDGGATGLGGESDAATAVPDASLPDAPNPDDARRSDLGRDRGPDRGRDSSPNGFPDLPAPIEDAPPFSAPDAGLDTGQNLTLVWSDDFDGDANTGVDTNTWSYVTWGPGSGGVNGEKQQYTSSTENVFLDGDGHLVVRAQKQQSQGAQYTSGRIQSKATFSFGGRIEVSAQLPSGQGSFPGIVMLGTNGSWPACGEIALMEQKGQPADKGSVYVSAYASGSASSGDKENVTYTFPAGTSPSDGYHIYSADWYADHLVFQIDGTEVMQTRFDTSSPFYTTPEYVVLDLAIGGTMGGAVDPSPNAFPMDMLVDYVRVYSF